MNLNIIKFELIYMNFLLRMNFRIYFKNLSVFLQNTLYIIYIQVIKYRGIYNERNYKSRQAPSKSEFARINCNCLFDDGISRPNWFLSLSFSAFFRLLTLLLHVISLVYIDIECSHCKKPYMYHPTIDFSIFSSVDIVFFIVV